MLTKTISLAEALAAPTDRGAISFTDNQIVVDLVNATGGALTIGELVMLDTTSAGVASKGGYFRVILPTVAGNLAAAGQFHLLAQGSIAAGATGRFLLYGNSMMSLAISTASVGAKIGTNGTAKTGELAAIVTLTKVVGLLQVATTGSAVVTKVFFNGMPPGLAIAP